MTTYTSHLRLTKQAVGENPDTWGLVLNESVFELLEDAITGRIEVLITAGSGPFVLTTASGASDQARNMIVEITGSPGGNRHIEVPDLNKVYLVHDKTTGGHSHTIKTNAGTGVVLTPGKPQWVYCDGTNVISVEHAATAVDAENVTTTIDNVVIATYARKDQVNAWTKSQSTPHVALTADPTIAVDCSLSNRFRVTLTGAHTLGDPTNMVTGLDFSIVVRQAIGGGCTLAYAPKWRWPGGTAPTLSTGSQRADIITGTYDSNTDTIMATIVQNFNLT